MDPFDFSDRTVPLAAYITGAVIPVDGGSAAGTNRHAHLQAAR